MDGGCEPIRHINWPLTGFFMDLFLRAFVDCADAQTAAGLQQKLCAALVAWASAEPLLAERYWKMPELFELTFRLTPAGPGAFDGIVACAPGGWHHVSDETYRSSVWNRSAGSSFLAPELAWAELQQFEPAP